MRKILLALFLYSISALAQVPDCSSGICAGVGVPSFACHPGQKYAQTDNPGLNWTCSGVPPHWVQDTGGGGDTITSPNSSVAVGGTSTNTTLDINFTQTNPWTALQTFNAGLTIPVGQSATFGSGNAIGAGGFSNSALLFGSGGAGFGTAVYNGKDWRVSDTGAYGFASTVSSAPDTTIVRTANGTVAIGTAYNNNGTLQLKQVTYTPGAFSTLPTCVAGLEGATGAVNDSTASTFGSTITGGGSNHILAYCNGTNWVVGG